MDVFDFKNHLNEIFEILSKVWKQVFLLGDFIIINLLNYNDHQPTNDFLDSLASEFFIPYILHPTRIASYSKTIIDNVFSNYISHEIISGNITAGLSMNIDKQVKAERVITNWHSVRVFRVHGVTPS